MNDIKETEQLIVSVDEASPAGTAGIKPGWSLLSLNGESVLDMIDYEQLSTCENLLAELKTSSGERIELSIKKDIYEPLGLGFESTLMSPIRTCKNHCIFCFIDQMPRGGRSTLHFKDDDWRLSLIMGNYITLTNVSDEEFDRIIRRRVSPLYVSVHATDGAVRGRMMRNPSALLIMERLSALAKAGLSFDSQIVLCPGYNDGDVLKKTLDDLYSLAPYARSVAVVPVGLTGHREGLEKLRPLTVKEARAAIAYIEAFSKRARRDTDCGFVYASDEMYVSAGLPLPKYDAYDDFVQIENGVGLLRLFEKGFIDALGEMEPLKRKTCVTGFTGESAHAFLSPLFERLSAFNIDFRLLPVKNSFFGGIVSVAGLVTATDIAAAAGRCGGTVVIPDDMLREHDDVFLDGKNIAWLSEALGARVLPLSAADGEEFIYGLFDGLKEVD